MLLHPQQLALFAIASTIGFASMGCATRGMPSDQTADSAVEIAQDRPASPAIQPVSWQQTTGQAEQRGFGDKSSIPLIQSTHATAVDDLVEIALAQNPRLRALQQEVAAAQWKVQYIDKLPDPTLGVNVFGEAIETAAGSQRANLTVMQRIPWLGRLEAQEQQACFDAMVIEQIYAVERLKVVADVRALWFQLYVLGKQVQVNEANRELLDSLVRIANARVAAGNASQGDVLLGTLEISRLAEQLITLRQQVASTQAELNRLLGRSAEFPIASSQHLNVALPSLTQEQLRQMAVERQPDIAAASLRVAASRWGVEVARMQQRPDISLSASWYAIDDNRPIPSVVDVGQDAWSIGVQVSLPLGREKYCAIRSEANYKHFATHATVEDTINRYDALLRDLWEQAKAADETAQLYRSTILPQAEQTLQADQQSYATGAVEFDRVIRDLRNVLTLQLEYHRAVGRLATALARIQQATGTDLPIANQQELVPLPPK